MRRIQKIGKILSAGSFGRYKKPLLAARVCDAARSISESRFEVISYKNGLLTLGVSSSAQAGNLQMESEDLVEKINQKLDDKLVEKIRFKLVSSL